MSETKNWPAYGEDGQPITATGTSVATPIAGNSYKVHSEDIMVYNPGPLFAFIKTGGATAVATELSIPVPPQTLSAYAKGDGMTHVATYCASGSQKLVVFVGKGA